jgi:hypothetical protein
MDVVVGCVHDLDIVGVNVGAEVGMPFVGHERESDVGICRGRPSLLACGQDTRHAPNLCNLAEPTHAPTARALCPDVLDYSRRNAVGEVDFEVVEGVSDRTAMAGVERDGEEESEEESGGVCSVGRAKVVDGGVRLCTLVVSMVEKASHQRCTLGQAVVSVCSLCCLVACVYVRVGVMVMRCVLCGVSSMRWRCPFACH